MKRERPNEGLLTNTLRHQYELQSSYSPQLPVKERHQARANVSVAKRRRENMILMQESSKFGRSNFRATSQTENEPCQVSMSVLRGMFSITSNLELESPNVCDDRAKNSRMRWRRWARREPTSACSREFTGYNSKPKRFQFSHLHSFTHLHDWQL